MAKMFYNCSRYNHRHQMCKAEEERPLCAGRHSLKDSKTHTNQHKFINCVNYNRHSIQGKLCEKHCLCIYVCTYVSTYMRMSICIYVCILILTYAYTKVVLRTCICMYLCTYIRGKVKKYPHFRHNTSLGLSHCLLCMHAQSWYYCGHVVKV